MEEKKESWIYYMILLMKAQLLAVKDN